MVYFPGAGQFEILGWAVSPRAELVLFANKLQAINFLFPCIYIS